MMRGTSSSCNTATSSSSSSSSETTKTYSLKNHNEDEKEEVDDIEKPKELRRGSSSNSTVEENERKTSSGTGVRPYVRSRMPRLRWTPDLHLCFVNAVERLGGQDRATPKLLLQMMNVKGLSIAHVKSHLQMYRSKKIDDSGQVITAQGQFDGGGDHRMYNISQLPMLQGYYNQRSTSNFRHDSSSLASGQSWRASPYMVGAINESERAAFFGLLAQRYSSGITDHLNFHRGNFDFLEQATMRNYQTNGRFRLCDSPSWRGRTSSSPRGRAPVNLLQTTYTHEALQRIDLDEKNKMKRKDSNCDLDLNLSLKTTSRDNEDAVDSNLSLTSFTPSSSRLKRFKDGDEYCKEREIKASTLDLTL